LFLRREEAKSLLRKNMPISRRVFGSSHENTLKMRTIYARTLYSDTGATLDDIREAVDTLVEVEQTARRVFGGTHPLTGYVEYEVREARAALRARETPSPGSV